MSMKNILGFLLLISLVGACKPDEAEIGTRYDLTTGIQGSWEVSKVEIYDLTLPVPESRDISDFYKTSSLELEFDTEAETYNVPTSDALGNPFGSGGTYTFDADEHPTAMMLISSDMDTINLVLENMVREIDPFMGFSITKSACGTNYASYTYTFKRK